MRRFVIAVIGTVAGLAALLSFKSASSTAGTTATASGTTSTPSASSGSTSKTATKTSGTSSQTGGTTLTGLVEQSPYGPTQVAVTLDGKKIVAVKVLQHTDDGTMSQQIDSNALPQLNKEALTAQSGKIDAVTGASYTSAGYIKSLQSALDKA
ncbi:MAG: FMN-binding protein [Streptosporangiaceae bacterium]|jgi:uncharacterized protein with FMN-binding domain